MEKQFRNQNPIDRSSLSNFHEVRQQSIEMNVTINFEAKSIEGNVNIAFASVVDVSPLTIVLDTKNLIIHKVTNEKGEEQKFEVEVNHPSQNGLGVPLVIYPQAVENMIITYETKPTSEAIQWFKEELTLTNKYPFCFTQCEAILARGLLPCQDSPSAKVTVKANLSVKSGITALFSGLKLKDSTVDGELTTFHYHQPIQIPTYLIAIAAGDLYYKKISDRCGVWAELPLLDRAAEEFSDSESYIKCCETYLNYPYIWTTYDIVVLPKAFPYGGMENPNLTFVTPALIVGDKSLANVISHEVAHSWTGNLVTNKDWGNFWMNEGFTVFMERKICELLYGEDLSKLEALVGYNELLYAIEAIGLEHEYCRLNIQYKDEDPDDAFSVIPYEKGFSLLYYLESLIGKDHFQKILQIYIKKYEYQSIEFDNFRNVLTNYVSENNLILSEEIEWDKWVYQPGHLVKNFDFSNKYIIEADVLYEAFQNLTATSDAYETFLNWHTNVKLVFLNKILNNIEKFNDESYKHLDSILKLNSTPINAEVDYTWLQVALALKNENSVAPAMDFLLKYGRMKYLRPVFRRLYRFKKEECRKFFDENKTVFSPIAARLIEEEFKRIDNSSK